jgi:kynurenine formamidase
VTLIDVSVPIHAGMPVYDLICLPLELVGSDGRRARAVLRPR